MKISRKMMECMIGEFPDTGFDWRFVSHFQMEEDGVWEPYDSTGELLPACGFRIDVKVASMIEDGEDMDLRDYLSEFLPKHLRGKIVINFYYDDAGHPTIVFNDGSDLRFNNIDTVTTPYGTLCHGKGESDE